MQNIKLVYSIVLFLISVAEAIHIYAVVRLNRLLQLYRMVRDD